MRQLAILLILISFFLSAKGQEFEYLKPSLDDSCEVIKKVVDKENYFEQLTYIDRKVSSKPKEIVSDFTLSDKKMYQIKSSFEEIRNHQNLEINKFDSELPEKWINIYKYKGEWMFYNDIEFNDKFILTDSLLINFDMDGLYSDVIINLKKKGNQYTFRIVGLAWGNHQANSEYELIIHIIDPTYKIAVWEFHRNDREYFSLKAPADMIGKFPIVNILATDLIANESEMFDKVDLKKLIK